MSQETAAYKDLIDSLNALPWLSVYTERGKSGARKWSIEVVAGTSRFVPKIGCRTKYNGYTLTLKSTAQTAPDDLSEKLGVIDDIITNDRRRGGNAQSTITDDAGWTPDEDEGRESFSITTNIEIQFNEVN